LPFLTRSLSPPPRSAVHRATLKSGEEAAAKIQYPGIGRAIKADLRNLMALIFPLRLTKGGQSIKGQSVAVRIFEEPTSAFGRFAASGFPAAPRVPCRFLRLQGNCRLQRSCSSVGASIPRVTLARERWAHFRWFQALPTSKC
jgi:hypothetical protein